MIPVIQCLIHILEAHHDKYVIAAQRHDRRDEVRMWHIIDAGVWTVVHGLIAYAAGDPWLFVTGLIIRWWVMQVYLNLIRNLPATHLGHDGIDALHRKYLGVVTGTVIKTVLFLLSLLYTFT